MLCGDSEYPWDGDEEAFPPNGPFCNNSGACFQEDLEELVERLGCVEGALA